MGNGIKIMSQVNFTDMSDANLERTLYDYSKTRSGEIADLTRAAAIRIGVLSARINQLETDKGDDRK
jgi:hypothetical protein